MKRLRRLTNNEQVSATMNKLKTRLTECCRRTSMPSSAPNSSPPVRNPHHPHPTPPPPPPSFAAWCVRSIDGTTTGLLLFHIHCFLSCVCVCVALQRMNVLHATPFAANVTPKDLCGAALAFQVRFVRSVVCLFGFFFFFFFFCRRKSLYSCRLSC
jgi:hypothetical protein